MGVWQAGGLAGGLAGGQTGGRAGVHACTLVDGRAVQEGPLGIIGAWLGAKKGQKGNKGPDLNTPPSQRFVFAYLCSIWDLIAQKLC